MEKAKLIIKYKNEYIVNKNRNELSFIEVPFYHGNSDFHNIDIFTTLLCFGYMDDDWGTTRGFTYEEGLPLFEYFDPDNLEEIDKNTFLYDLDKLCDENEEFRATCDKYLENLPGNLERHSYAEIIKMSHHDDPDSTDFGDEEVPHVYDFLLPRVDEALLKFLKQIHLQRTDKDVLLLYSGGKDSTLAAIRLRNQGYNVHFVHFDNGSMRDEDKPYLTFQNSFGLKNGYYFDYSLHSRDVSKNFQDFFEKWAIEKGDTLEHGTMTSEVRCLSCRMAMYVEALCIAKAKGFSYIAEGARISQKFMLEQEAMINRLKDLAKRYGIELMFPVLTLEDDETEKRELIENGFSSKGWESKCLLGRAAMDKTAEDEDQILAYYEETLKPKMLRLVDQSTKAIDKK